MKAKIIFLGVLFFLGTVNFTNAQIGNYMKSKAATATRRAGQQSDKEVDKEINKAVDKGVTDVFNKLRGDENQQPATNQSETETTKQPTQSSENHSSKSRSGSGSNDAMSRALMGKLGISMERPANIKDRYDYNGNMLMSLQSWDSEGNTDGEVLYTTHYTSDNKGFAMDFKSNEKGDSKIIFDYENNLMIILGDDGKDRTGMVMAYGSYSAGKDTTVQGTDDQIKDYNEYYSTFKKTGSSKNIAGYRCDEYAYEDNERKDSYWLTTELSADLWANIFNANAITSVYAGRPNGFIMEWNNERKDSKEKSQMIVKEVSKNQSSSVSTVGYTFMSFGGPKNAPKEQK